MTHDSRSMLRAVCFAALFACFWTSSLMVRQSAADVPFFLHYTSRAVEIAVCLVVALLTWRRGVRERDLRRGACGAVTAYVLIELVRLVASPQLPGATVSLLSAVSGVANGASVALLVLLFARGLCALGLRQSVVIVPASLGCSHAFFLLAGGLPTVAIPWTKLVLLAVAAVGLALWLHAESVEELTSVAAPVLPSASDADKTPLARLTLWLGMAVFPLLYGFMAQICAAAQVSSGLFDFSTELVDVACMGALAVGALFHREQLDVEGAFAVILSVFATAFLFLPVFWGNEVFIAGFIMKCGFAVYTAMLWVALLRTVEDGAARCFGVFGLALGVYHAALMVGRLAAYGLTTYGLLSYQTVSFAALAVVWLLSMVALAVLFANRRSHARAARVLAQKPRDYEEAFDAFAASWGLSDRERAVCREYARGRTVDYIAANLHVSQETVKTHLKRAYAKTDCHSRQDLLDRIDGCRMK